MVKVTKLSSILMLCMAMEIVAMEPSIQSLSNNPFLSENETLKKAFESLSPRDFKSNKAITPTIKPDDCEIYLHDDCEVRVALKDKVGTEDEALPNWCLKGELYTVTKNHSKKDSSKKEDLKEKIDIFSDLEEACTINFKPQQNSEK